MKGSLKSNVRKI